MTQLDLFNDIEIVKKEVNEIKESSKKVKDSSDNVRRGLFARYHELSKKQDKLEIEVNDLKALLRSIIPDRESAEIINIENIQ